MPLMPIVVLALRFKTALTHQPFINFQILCNPSVKYRSTKVKVEGRRRNCFCFTITEIRYLLVGLFHDLVQPPRNDICDTE